MDQNPFVDLNEKTQIWPRDPVLWSQTPAATSQVSPGKGGAKHQSLIGGCAEPIQALLPVPDG